MTLAAVIWTADTDKGKSKHRRTSIFRCCVCLLSIHVRTRRVGRQRLRQKVNCKNGLRIWPSQFISGGVIGATKCSSASDPARPRMFPTCSSSSLGDQKRPHLK